MQCPAQNTFVLPLALDLALARQAAILDGQQLGPEQRVQRTLGNVLKYLLLGAFLANIPQLAIFPQLELPYRLKVYISRQNICLGLLGHRVNGIQRFAAALVLYFLLQFCFCDFPG